MRACPVVLASLLLVSPFSASASPGFFDLGELPPDPPYDDGFNSRAEGVSGDGTVVVGSASLVRNVPDCCVVVREQAFRWENGVMTGMDNVQVPADPDHERSLARGVNYDGTVVTGNLYRHGSPVPTWQGGFTWIGTTVTPLGDLPGGSYWSVGYGASDDGTVISAHSVDAVTDRAARWESGLMLNLGTTTGYSYSYAVSGDGYTIVGYQLDVAMQAGFAHRWDGTIAGGVTMMQLRTPPTSFGTRAFGISADGSTIVGRSRESFGDVATRWNAYNAVKLLGTIPGDLTSVASDASIDGKMIIGRSRPSGGIDRAFIWDRVNRMQSLQDVLVNVYGFDLLGWTLNKANGISDDGTVIVGTARNAFNQERAFMAILGGPSAPTCNNGLDDDGDGATDYPDDDGCDGLLDISEEHDCIDGLDNDGDGLVDYGDGGDPGCRNELAMAWESPGCEDGIDNDNDLLIDDADPQCAASPAWWDHESRPKQPPACSVSIAATATPTGWLVLLPALIYLRRRKAARGWMS